jgi:hypothetical protein
MPESRMLPQPGRRVRWTWSSQRYTCKSIKLLASRYSLIRYSVTDSENFNDFSSYRIKEMTDDGMGKPKGISDAHFLFIL